MSSKSKIFKFLKSKTKRDSLAKFILISLVLLVYLIVVSINFGTGNGILITLLTWSFFVFCTPVADAGFLIDFPVRLITKFRMIYSEIIVWLIAFFINLYTFLFRPEMYHKTLILKLFHHIITQPFPYWGIIIISGVGTFLSIYFGDELMDVTTHSKRKKYYKYINKYQIIIFIFLIGFIIILYDFLIKKMGINIHL